MKIIKILRHSLIYTTVAVFAVSCGSRGQRQPVAEEGVQSFELLEQIVPEGWVALMDGTTMSGWETVRYGGEGEPYVRNGVMILPRAVSGFMTGISWVGDSLPTNNYAIYYEARRVEGYDIFAGLSFPYGDSFATLIVGGWGGAICGLSSIDGRDASSNETTKMIHFKDEQWYPVYLRVAPDSIQAVIDTVKVVDISTAGKRIHLRGGTDVNSLTFTTYLTTGEIRGLRIKRFD